MTTGCMTYVLEQTGITISIILHISALFSLIQKQDIPIGHHEWSNDEGLLKSCPCFRVRFFPRLMIRDKKVVSSFRLSLTVSRCIKGYYYFVAGSRRAASAAVEGRAAARPLHSRRASHRTAPAGWRWAACPARCTTGIRPSQKTGASHRYWQL